MKRFFAMFLALLLIFSFYACGNTSDTETETDTQHQTESQEADNLQISDTPVKSKEKTGVFNKNASISETVMYDENGVKITATGLDYTNYSVELNLVLENNSGKDLSFISGSMGYSCNSVNGYMVSDGYLNCDVANGKKANDTISFSYDNLMICGISEIADIEIGFDISDESYKRTYTGPIQLKTSVFESHDYSKDYYIESITKRAMRNAFDYKVVHFSQDCLYDINGVKHLSSGLMINHNEEPAVLLEFENTTSETVHLATLDISINDLVINSSSWSSDTVNPGKRVIIDVELSSILDSKFWNIYGINDIGSVEITLSQSNSDREELAEDTSINFQIPGVKKKIDASGQEIYNKDGLRIISKAVLDDSSDYSSDMYVLLLAENKSGNTLTIDDEYDSLSVNGYMTDYSYYSKEIPDGSCAVLAIKLWEFSLEDNNISSAADVKEVEVKFEIKDGRNTFDTPVVTIFFD